MTLLDQLRTLEAQANQADLLARRLRRLFDLLSSDALSGADLYRALETAVGEARDALHRYDRATDAPQDAPTVTEPAQVEPEPVAPAAAAPTPDGTVETRVCKECGETRPLTDYRKAGPGGGRLRTCPDCMTAKVQAGKAKATAVTAPAADVTPTTDSGPAKTVGINARSKARRAKRLEARTTFKTCPPCGRERALLAFPKIDGGPERRAECLDCLPVGATA